SITPQLAFEPLLEGHAKGTTISVANLVSYLIGWGELVLHWHDQEAKGKTIIFPEEGFKWNELGRLAQKF
ncbi:colibactin self-protection protein ClbS, partial [Klebsiella pneumoniae]|nr:colibactin self-protection protein ClbS [Klebsiella pneumoniae]